MSNVVWKGDESKDADAAEEEDATGSQADRALRRGPRPIGSALRNFLADSDMDVFRTVTGYGKFTPRVLCIWLGTEVVSAHDLDTYFTSPPLGTASSMEIGFLTLASAARRGGEDFPLHTDP